nr:transposase [Bradyrhizobium sp. Ec3.3]
MAGILPQTSVWVPGTGRRPPKKWTENGGPPKLLRRDSKHRPISVKKLAISLPVHAWHKITWREATAEQLSTHFPRVRVRPAHRDYWLAESRPEEWLLVEWPEGATAPTKYWFSTIPASIGFRQLVDIAKLRWRIEARLTRIQTGGRPWPLRGAGLARLPPSRNAVHRRLWIPGLGARNDFLLSNSLHQNLQGSYDSRKLSAEGICHCGLNGTFQIRLRPPDED